MGIQFTVTHTYERARAGNLILSDQRQISTPVFMPVGTQATVKTLDSQDLNALGVKIMLCNAYHLYLRPGAELIQASGGLHRFMNWQGGIITDSGGYQVFSLPSLRKIRPEGVEFISHLDGSQHLFTPELNMRLQHQLGADIIMALDLCTAYPAPVEEVHYAVELTSAWAKRCLKEHEKLGGNQALFGIIQGSTLRAAREHSAQELIALDLPGYGIGGLSVGEGPILMNEMLSVLEPLLPEEKPRYLMGVGTPEDLWNAIGKGMDMFDCAMPTRIARNGTLYTTSGRVLIKNAIYAKDWSSPDPQCACLLCTHYSRAYLRHLFKTHELSALRLSTLHNLTFMLNLTRFIREAIRAGEFEAARKDFFDQYQAGDIPE